MPKKNLAEVLQADVMTNLPVAALAQIVRSKGRGRDTVLAHITPREAKKLKREGGRGSINPETGLLEFEDGFDFTPSFTEFPMSIDYSAAQAPAALTQVPETAYQAPITGYQGPSSYGFYGYQPTADMTSFTPLFGGESYVGSMPGQYAQAVNLGPASGSVPSARDFIVRPDVAAAPKAELRATPQQVQALTPDQETEVRTSEELAAAADEARARDEYETRQRQIAAGQATRAAAAGPSEAPSAAAVAAGGPAAPANVQNAVSTAITTAGLDVAKLSTSDMSRLTQIQSLVNSGTMTVEQAQAAINDLAKGQGFTGGLTRWLSDPSNSLKLALGIGAGALGMFNMANARSQAANVQAQMQNMANQYRTMAQPFLQQGGLQFGLGTQGALTPASQQQFDVARAQLAQAAARTGSVGAMQATQIAEQLRQQALNNQITQGMQILAAGNSAMGNALSTEMQALNQRLSLTNQANQAATNFYTQLAGLFGGVKG